MSFENPNNFQESQYNSEAEMLNVIRKQIQTALAFSDLPRDISKKEESAIIIARLKKNSPKFNIIFDEMIKNNPNLLNDWHENSYEILETIRKQMKMMPELPVKEDTKHWGEMEKEAEGNGEQIAA